MHTEHEDKYTGGAYERSDIDFDMLIKFGIGLFVLVVGSYLVSAPFVWVKRQQQDDFYWGEADFVPVRTSNLENREPMRPNTPVLQDHTTAEADIAIMRRHEEDVLDKGAPNAETKQTSIPIQQAIDEEAAAHGG